MTRFRTSAPTFLGLFGQGLNFVALLIPIGIHRFEQVAFLVVASAVGNVASQMGTLAFPSIFPTLPSSETARSVASALGGTLVVSIIVAVAGGVSYLLSANRPIPGELLAGAVMCVCLGIYQLSVAGLVRVSNPRVFGSQRLLYGVVNVVTTTAAAAWIPSVVGLVAANSFTLLLVAGFILFRERMRVRVWATVVSAPTWRDIRAYVFARWSATLGTLLGSVAFQATSFVIPLLGPFGTPWAVVIRVVGGFGSVVQQVFAPLVEMRYAQAIRDRNAKDAASAVRRGLVTGISLGLATVLIAVGVALVSGSTDHLGDQRVMFVVIAVGLAMGIIVPAPISRFLIMSSRPHQQLALAATKLALAVLLIFVFQGSTIAVGLGLLEVLNAVATVTLVVRNGLRDSASRFGDPPKAV